MIGPGTELDGFVIEGVTGRGGMGVVYRARQRRPERIVALKVIAAGLADDPQFAARFRRESTIAAQIEHPNVIPVHAVGEADGVLYIAMRFVVGTDLRALLAQEGRLEPRRAARIADQVAQALDAAHLHGLVHRDVKPANILISTAGGREHVYLSDFGVSRHIEGSQALTDSGAFVGTVDYVSPEQARGGRVDARSDVYSLGCVFFEALTGTVPFPLENNLAKLYAHDSKPPPSVLERAPDVPAAFEPVLVRAMAKSADDRYPSAGDLGRAASAAVSGESVPAAERSVAVGEAAPKTPAATTQLSTPDAALIASALRVPTEATPTGRRSPVETGPGADRRIARASHRQIALAGAFAIAIAAAAGVVVALAHGRSPLRVATLRVPSQYRTIQAAVNAAKSGETIAVGTGRFTQQLTIRKRLILTGTGVNSTTISAPSSLAPGPLAGLRSIVTVVNGAHVAISHLKIAGPRTPSCASPSDLGTGILVGQNATLDLQSAAVTNIRDIPAGCVKSRAWAVAVEVGVSGTGSAFSGNAEGGVPAGGYASAGHATIKGDLISGYGEEGIDVAGSGSTATISGSHISGIGSSSTLLVHGLVVEFGGTATIVGNTINGNQCTSPRAAASLRGGKPCGPAFHQAHDKGISVSLTGPGTVIRDNKLSGNDVGITLVKAPSCCTISHNMLVGNRYFGDLIWDSGTSSVNDDIISGSRVGVGVVARSDNTFVALHGVSIRRTTVAPIRTYSCCGRRATVVP